MILRQCTYFIWEIDVPFSHTYFFATCISNFFFSSYSWCSFSFTNVANLLLTHMVCPIAILCQEKVWNKKKLKMNNLKKINNVFLYNQNYWFSFSFYFQMDFFFPYPIFLYDNKTKSVHIQWNSRLGCSSIATAGSDKKGEGCMELLPDLLSRALHRQLCYGMANEQAKRSQQESEIPIYHHYHQRKRRKCTQNTFRDLFHSPNDFICDFQMCLKRKFHQWCSTAFFFF